MTLRDRVIAICEEQLGIIEGELKGHEKIVDDLGADSLDTIELIMALEEEFEIEIMDDDAEKVITIDQAVDLVSRIVAE